MVTAVVRFSSVERAKEWSWPVPPTGMRSQEYSSMRMRAPVMPSAVLTKWRPSRSAKSSISPIGASLAKA